MSLLTWKREFAPMMSGVQERNWTNEEALDWSINKWIGLREANLFLHEVHWDFDKSGGFIEDNHSGDRADISDETCPLCVMHLTYLHDDSERCGTCPLFHVLGERCDKGDEAPYNVWDDLGDPEPMIGALIAARKTQQEKTNG